MSLEERIDGVEDQLEIELDHRRNELVCSQALSLARLLSICITHHLPHSGIVHHTGSAARPKPHSKHR